MSDTFSKRLFFVSTIFIASLAIFSYGLVVSRFQIWPYAIISEIFNVSKSLVSFGKIIPHGLILEAPADASRQRFAIHRPDLATGGYYAFMGWNEHSEGYAVWLYSTEGELLHTWTWEYKSLDPDGPLNRSDMPHDMAVLHDGSIIVNFDDGDVMARLDACSQLIWTKRGVYHHSLTRAEDGNYWAWRGEGTPISQYHYMEKFDPDTGEMITEIGLVEDIINNSAIASTVFGVRPDFQFSRFEKGPPPIEEEKYDIFHPNDIDVLYSDLAGKFPDFRAGDLLLSFRNLHLIAVLDPDTKKLKWWSHGPWRFQHDPDFTSDGKISVYNNNSGRHRSEILKIDPLTREVRNDLFSGELNFYTEYMGKHQYLPNGNILVTVPGEGRIIEVTDKGMKVLEFNNVATEFVNHNYQVENGIWLPEDYFKQLPRCSK